MDTASKRARFRSLHEKGCFFIPNPWDVGSAKRLQKMGFAALASTSSGAAWAVGKEDGELTLEEVLQHLTALSAATDLPVNADFEAGFADTPQQLARNVRAAIATGIAGLSIEDFSSGRLLEINEAVERIHAAREAIDSSGENVMLIGRSEGFVRDHPDLPDTVQRLRAYSEAGADCLYAPGITDLSAIREIVAAVAPKPVNVLMSAPGLYFRDLAEMGVRRVSLGGALAKVAWKAFDTAGRALLDKGTLVIPR